MTEKLMLRIYVTKHAPWSPAAAPHWAEDIGDTPLRLQAMEAAGEGWLANDAPGRPSLDCQGLFA